MAPNSTLYVLTLWGASVLIVMLSQCNRTEANFIEYVDESGENVPEDYVLDTHHRRKKVRPQDYNEALDRLISDALNQTTVNDTSSEELSSSSAEPSIACIGERQVRKEACRILLIFCLFVWRHRKTPKKIGSE
uniref:Uncharacterized protein n=1 Tax=Anopheles culicifacies TaxID=139723 RepID=A0A182MWN8_9DIPT